MIERVFEYTIVIIAIYAIYWMGRIDGFTKRETSTVSIRDCLKRLLTF